MNPTSRWQAARRLAVLALLAATVPAATANAPTTGPGEGWVALPSGGRLYYRATGAGPDTIVVPGAVVWSTALAPLAWSVYTIVSKRLVGTYGALPLATYALGIGTLMLAPFAIGPTIRDLARRRATRTDTSPNLHLVSAH